MTSPLTLQDDMTDIFLDSGFQEDIIYTPSGGSAKTIKAIVYRNNMESTTTAKRTGRDSRSKSRFRNISIHIATDSTEGIADVVVREDKVQLKKDYTDGSNTTFYVSGIIENDEGAWLLGINQ